MILSIIATALFVLMFAVEAKSLRRSTTANDRDQSSLKYILWAVAALPVGVWLGATNLAGHIKRGEIYLQACGLLLLLLGWFIRQRAIATLREYFTINVAVQHNQQLITNGLYRSIRHPSYTGYLLRFLGLGLAWANWLTILIIFIPQLMAVLYRIRVEEKALTEAFDGEYLRYCRTTKKLIPKIY